MKGGLGDCLFRLYDTSKSERVKLPEFLQVSCRFFQPSIDSKLHLVFDIFDADCDGRISGPDIQAVLSHIPLEAIVVDCFSSIDKLP